VIATAQIKYNQDQQALWEKQLQVQQQFIESMKSQSQSITSWLAELKGGNLSPVQSMSTWGSEYNRLKGIAYSPAVMDETGKQTSGATSSDISAFLSYAKDYLTQMKANGSTNYKDIFGMVSKDVEQLGTIFGTEGLMSSAGFGNTETQLRGIIKLFTDAGTPLKDLNTYMQAYVDVMTKNGGAVPTTQAIKDQMQLLSDKSDTANISTGGLVGTLQGTKTPFENVQAAITSIQQNLGGFTTLDTFFKSLATNLGVAYNTTTAGQVAGQIFSSYGKTLIEVPFGLVNTGFGYLWQAIYNGQILASYTALGS